MTEFTEEMKKEFLRMDLLTMSSITTQLTLHYLERLKGMESPYYNKELKRTGNLFLPHLLKCEEQQFNKLQDHNEERIEFQTELIQNGIEFMAKNGFTVNAITSKFNKAYNYNSKRIMGLIDKIIRENEK